MGCICSKGTKANQYVETQHQKEEIKSSKRFSASFRGDGVVVEVDGGANDVTLRLITNQPAHNNVGSTPVSSDEGEKAGTYVKAKQQGHATAEVNAGPVQPRMTRIVSIGEKGAQVVAGWPSWLTVVAGEAISGWVPRKADSFEKLDKIGQGTYSSVYRARDLDANKIVALKKVRFANMDPESVRFMAREILMLRRLDHPNVMKLEGIITSRVSGSLYLIFEYMEHDLAGLAATPGIKFTEAQIKCYMQQLLRGLEHCHSRGVLHRDIKSSNLLLDNKGNLKIGDFGLATLFQANQQQPLTSRVVTLWFRPPELLLGATNYGVAVDLWSTGCILAELFAGKPIMPGRTEVEQLHKIFKLCGSPSEEYWKRSKLPHATIFKPQRPYKRCVAETFKDFPSSALDLLDVLLAIEPEGRGTAFSALQSQFFTTQPLPCDPSTLPKYSPSKEFDAKLRNEENRRRRAPGGKGRGHESVKKNSKESKTVPVPDANSELPASIQKQIEQHNPKSNSEKFNPEEDGGSGFAIEPSRGAKLNIYSHSGQSMHPGAFGSSRNMNVNEDETTTAPGRAFSSSRTGVELRTQRSYIHRGSSQLSRFSNSIAIRGGTRFVSGEEILTARYHHLDDGESSERSEWSVHIRDRRNSSRKKDEQMTGKESIRGYAPRNNRIHYSAPLLPLGGGLEEMLKVHEKQIQHAVRKARFDKTKTKTKKTHSENGQADSLLYR